MNPLSATGALAPAFETRQCGRITIGVVSKMEKAAWKGGLFKFQCPGDLQAAVTPEPNTLLSRILSVYSNFILRVSSLIARIQMRATYLRILSDNRTGATPHPSQSAIPFLPPGPKGCPPGRQVLADNYPPPAHNHSMNKSQSRDVFLFPGQSVRYVPGPHQGPPPPF